MILFRGTSVVLICPVDGMEAIANPFVQQVKNPLLQGSMKFFILLLR